MLQAWRIGLEVVREEGRLVGRGLGVTNTAKHAQVPHVDPSAMQPGGWLDLVVADDGRGGADASRGSGLTGLVDRVGAIGGTIAPIPERAQERCDAASPSSVASAPMDATSRKWLEQLREGHPRHGEAVARLHELLRRVAAHELSRRRSQLRSVRGPEFDDLVGQAANDALIKVLSRLDDFRGRSRFSTWAYQFAIFEVSAKVARHAWQRQPPGLTERDVDLMSNGQLGGPSEQLERRLQLQLLGRAIEELTERQREVFVAVALNGVSIDVMALRLGTNRNAVYKSLFDARRALRRKLEAAGLPLSDHTDKRSAAFNLPKSRR